MPIKDFGGVTFLIFRRKEEEECFESPSLVYILNYVNHSKIQLNQTFEYSIMFVCVFLLSYKASK